MPTQTAPAKETHRKSRPKQRDSKPVLSSSYHPHRTPRAKATPLRPHSRKQSHTPATGGPSKRFDGHGPHLDVGLKTTAKTPYCCQSAPLEKLSLVTSSIDCLPSSTSRSFLFRAPKGPTSYEARARLLAHARQYARPRARARAVAGACVSAHACVQASAHGRTYIFARRSEPMTAKQRRVDRQ